ncbi:MAG: LysM domain-containing protein, partial [Paramuribaculum sp.]|nr:LysM domain-containing protein [Paramuribaculum sp.]
MKFFILSLAFMMICSVMSADVTDLPTKVIDGAIYHYYEVQPKETVYSLCRRFGISKEDLYRDNPEVARDGLKAGATLVFKASSKPVRVVTLHVVKKGD